MGHSGGQNDENIRVGPFRWFSKIRTQGESLKTNRKLEDRWDHGFMYTCQILQKMPQDPWKYLVWRRTKRVNSVSDFGFWASACSSKGDRVRKRRSYVRWSFLKLQKVQIPHTLLSQLAYSSSKYGKNPSWVTQLRLIQAPIIWHRVCLHS